MKKIFIAVLVCIATLLVCASTAFAVIPPNTTLRVDHAKQQFINGGKVSQYYLDDTNGIQWAAYQINVPANVSGADNNGSPVPAWQTDWSASYNGNLAGAKNIVIRRGYSYNYDGTSDQAAQPCYVTIEKYNKAYVAMVRAGYPLGSNWDQYGINSVQARYATNVAIQRFSNLYNSGADTFDTLSPAPGQQGVARYCAYLEKVARDELFGTNPEVQPLTMSASAPRRVGANWEYDITIATRDTANSKLYDESTDFGFLDFGGTSGIGYTGTYHKMPYDNGVKKWTTFTLRIPATIANAGKTITMKSNGSWMDSTDSIKLFCAKYKGWSNSGAYNEDVTQHFLSGEAGVYKSTMLAQNTLQIKTPALTVITASATGPGSVSPSGSKTLLFGDNPVTYYPVLPSGVVLDSVVIDGINHGKPSSSVIGWNGYNRTIVVNTNWQYYDVKASVDRVGKGTVSPTSQRIRWGLDANPIQITPAEGYYNTDVKINGTSVGPKDTYTFTNVKSNQSLVAYFAKKPDLVIMDATLDKQLYYEKDKIKVTATIANIGELPTNYKGQENFDVNISFPDIKHPKTGKTMESILFAKIDTKQLSNIEPLGFQKVTFEVESQTKDEILDWTNVPITIFADSGGVIDEANENNNKKTIHVKEIICGFGMHAIVARNYYDDQA